MTEIVHHRDWRLEDDALVRELGFRDFDAALAFAEQLARCAVDYFRRPDLCITEFNRVRLIIRNPHHAGITEAERRLAGKVDACIARAPAYQEGQ